RGPGCARARSSGSSGPTSTSPVTSSRSGGPSATEVASSCWAARSRARRAGWETRVGKPVDALNLVHRVRLPLLEKAGVRRIRFDDLRHTYASVMTQRRESLAYVKDQ